ncbi:radical SAM protein [Patescibacteria group bacterium]|nr:radical SAM protein [Patescibacteria group bacterium]MBU0847415.1 radical SAM protein [Patescibacteria group bacterium]
MQDKGEWLNPNNPFNSWKVLAWADRIRGIIDGQFQPPVTVNWDLVLGCNYRCQHCIWSKRRGLPHTKVPDEFIKTVPKFLHDWGVKGVCFGGESGDCSLHPQLATTLRLLHYWNLDIGIATNGYAFSHEVLEAIANYSLFIGFSMDAGDRESYSKVHGVPQDYFNKVLENIEYLANYTAKNDLPLQIAYKFLILPDSYHTIAEGARIAKNIGVRDFQVRPAELPDSEIAEIDIQRVEEQINQAHELNTEAFRVYSIRHKFIQEQGIHTLEKKRMKHCWATPLINTWTADGDVVCCVDLIDEAYNTLCNYIKDGLDEIRRVWGTPEHLALIKGMNEKLDKCKRCTFAGYNEIIENCFAHGDTLDLNML